MKKVILYLKTKVYRVYSYYYANIYVKQFLYHTRKYRQSKYISKLRKSDSVNVVFLPMNVGMWKYQCLYDTLKKDPRFKLYVFLSPASSFNKETRQKDLKEMREYFDKHHVDYIDYKLEKDEPIVKIESIVDPDIIFYTQPYLKVYEKPHRYLNFTGKLLCYAPYGFIPRSTEFFFKTELADLCWRYYYQTTENMKNCKKYARDKGANAFLCGYLSADEYLKDNGEDVWKHTTGNRKRIIWAPHFTIIPGIGFAKVSYFLEMAEYMKKIVVEYSDRVSFAFKPHPRLYSELVRHPDWGEEKTQEYYSFWENSENTQLETGDFTNLFRSSDAMIHDCGSFTVDYLYFNKPVMYDSPNMEVLNSADKNGIMAYDLHYRLTHLDDINKFIDDVVIGGNDPLKQKRIDFFNEVLKTPNNSTVAQIMYDDFVSSIWGKND